MQRYGRDVDSVDHWSDAATDYVAALQTPYHRHRMEVIQRLVPRALYAEGKRIYDFGCGDAIVFPAFLEAGARIEGHDIAPEMIAMAREGLTRRGHDPTLVDEGGVSAMAALPDASYDAILSFNVLAYLTADEERMFYEHAARILRPGGHLILTHSNELFDLYSFNGMTAAFVAEQLADGSITPAAIGGLLQHPDEPRGRTTFNVRENPLAYRHKLARLGFDEVQQEFGNLHPVPPLLQQGEKEYPSTELPDDRRWTLMFTCSTYGSRSVRQGAGEAPSDDD